MALVKIDKLVKRYPVGKSEFTALKDVNLTFEKGEFCGLIGPSGSGKTTLLNIVGSLDAPTEGSVTVMDKRIEDLSHKEAAKLRRSSTWARSPCWGCCAGAVRRAKRCVTSRACYADSRRWPCSWRWRC